MTFKEIDKKKWKRTPYFDFYLKQIRCTYSMTINLDITPLVVFKQSKGFKLYPLLIYILTKAVNRRDEFRTAFNSDNKLGIYSFLNPSFTIFHPEDESFSSIWTSWNEDLNTFMSNYHSDFKQYSTSTGEISPKPDSPENICSISSIPWATFTSFNLNIYNKGNYLLPLFTYGKSFTQGDRILIPLAGQVHHAVCDGFHICRLFNDIQNYIDTF